MKFLIFTNGEISLSRFLLLIYYYTVVFIHILNQILFFIFFILILDKVRYVFLSFCII